MKKTVVYDPKTITVTVKVDDYRQRNPGKPQSLTLTMPFTNKKQEPGEGEGSGGEEVDRG